MEGKGEELNELDDEEDVEFPGCDVEVPEERAEDVEELDFELFLYFLEPPLLVRGLALGVQLLRVVLLL